jgi:hypothetical protein
VYLTIVPKEHLFEGVMKVFYTCLAFSLFIGSEAVSTSDWGAYKQNFNKIYHGIRQDSARRSVFEQNLLTYAKLNALEPLARYGPTAFSDMKPEEYLGGYTPSTTTPPELHVDTSLKIATSKDWTGTCTSGVKDQGHCGSCWAESALQQIESDAMCQHNWTGVLSTQELVDCTSAGQGSWRAGCGGGNPTDGYDTIKAIGGVVSGYDYPYQERDGRCAVDNFTKYVKVESYKSVGINNETVMKSYIASSGPLSVCVDANDWGGYSGGIKTTCGTSIDHCVQLVGYGTEMGTDYWKVRNSWGNDWGEDGYVRLKIGGNLCKLANGPTATSTSVVGPAPIPSPSPGCSDRPDWKSSEGDPCSVYELNNYCTADRSNYWAKNGAIGEGIGRGWYYCNYGNLSDYADSKGYSALDACCACGGGTKPTPPAPPTPSPPPPTCNDHPKSWRSSEGDSCCAFVWDEYCTPEGGEGPSWDHKAWGPISNYADKNGISALQACCGCGGGTNKTASDDDEKFV